MEQYIEEFNSLNHSNFKLKDIFCSACKEVCNCNCVNSTIKELLRDMQFPCRFDDCSFQGVLSDFHEHGKECKYGPFKCLLDNQLFDKAGTFIEHFTTHENVRKETLDLPYTTVHLNLTERKDEIILIDFKKNYFIIIIKYLEDTISFKVGKHLAYPCPSLKTFTLVQKYEKGQAYQKEEILPLLTLLNSEENDNSLLLKTVTLAPDAEVTIHFYDLEKMRIQLNDCPICYKPLFADIRQCLNNHAFCVSCASKMATCPICRENITDFEVSLKHILSDHSFSCMNEDEGCLELINLNDKAVHSKLCAFRKLLCSDCKVEYLAHQFCAHFMEKHRIINNFSSLMLTFKTEYTSSIYVLYRSKLFCVNMKYANSTLQFLVELVHYNDDCAAKYSYQVILKKGNDVIASIGNICVGRDLNDKLNAAKTTTTYYSTINLDLCKAQFYHMDTWIIKCQFKILLNQGRNSNLEVLSETVPEVQDISQGLKRLSFSNLIVRRKEYSKSASIKPGFPLSHCPFSMPGGQVDLPAPSTSRSTPVYDVNKVMVFDAEQLKSSIEPKSRFRFK